MGSGGFTYIMTNREFGVLYVGVTADIHARIAQHRHGRGSEFCRKYGLDQLVWSSLTRRFKKPLRARSSSSVGVGNGNLS